MDLDHMYKYKIKTFTGLADFKHPSDMLLPISENKHIPVFSVVVRKKNT